MKIEEFLLLSPQNLATAQRAKLEECVLSVLNQVKTCIQSKQYNNIPTFYSPAGDDMGMDNTCIDFLNGMDIGDIIQKFKELDEVIKVERIAK